MMVMTWSTTSKGRSIYTIMIIYISIDRLHWPDHQHPIIILLYNIRRHRVQEPYTDQALHGLLTVRRTEELI